MLLPSYSAAIVACYCAAFLFLVVALQWLVILRRNRLDVGLGTGGHPEMEKAIRVHGNYTENATFAMVSLVLLLLLSAPPLVLHGVGLSMLLGRLLHAMGILQSAGPTFGRIAGMILTQGSLVIAATTLLYSAFRLLS
jgi:uncharacterized protein